MFKNFRHLCLSHPAEPVSEGHCLIIGEVAQTHDGSLGTAHAFIDAIADAGADAVKFQTHIAAAETSPAEPWRIKFSRQDATRYDYWRRMEFTREQWSGLKQHADERGLLFLSTPFSDEAAHLLKEIGMKVWKIASGEIGNLPLLQQIIETGDPVILSSGMSDWEELDRAVKVVQTAGNPLAVLQCTSAYPCPPERVGLNLLEIFRHRYRCPVGLSDHSGNIFAGLAAVTLGADVLEVHVTLSREMFGPDVPASVTTAELKQLVEGSRIIERIVSNPVEKETVFSELKPLREIFTKSIVASTDLPAGKILGSGDLRLKKPGTGLPASSLPQVIGKQLQRNLKAGEMLLLQDLNTV